MKDINSQTIERNYVKESSYSCLLAIIGYSLAFLPNHSIWCWILPSFLLIQSIAFYALYLFTDPYVVNSSRKEIEQASYLYIYAVALLTNALVPLSTATILFSTLLILAHTIAVFYHKLA
jgi:hypothetical protein